MIKWHLPVNAAKVFICNCLRFSGCYLFQGLMQSCNQMQACYLFQQDKHYDLSYDTGDKALQCGRHVDIFKLWLMWRAKVLRALCFAFIEVQKITFQNVKLFCNSRFVQCDVVMLYLEVFYYEHYFYNCESMCTVHNIWLFCKNGTSTYEVYNTMLPTWLFIV